MIMLIKLQNIFFSEAQPRGCRGPAQMGEEVHTAHKRPATDGDVTQLPVLEETGWRQP